MSISDLMEAMSNAGAPMEAILLAVRALEAKDAEISARRANDRERKQRQRAKDRGEDGAVTGQSRDMDVTVTVASPFPAPSPSFPPNPQTNPTPTHTRDKPPRARKADDFELPERIPAEPWREFVAMRRRIGKPLTPHAMNLAVIELDKLAADGWPPGDVLNNSTLNSYQGLFPPKDRRNGTNRQNRPAADEPRDPMVRAGLAREAQRSGAERGAPF